jgi:hypothetical protein
MAPNSTTTDVSTTVPTATTANLGMMSPVRTIEEVEADIETKMMIALTEEDEAEAKAELIKFLKFYEVDGSD